MSRHVTVSVIIPTFNYGQYIERTIASVQAQTLTDWECLVVDDGSADDTRDIVAAIAAADHRVSFLSQPSSGVSAARNAGLRATTGALIQFLDADDLIGPLKLELQTALLASHPEVGLVYGDARYFRDAMAGSPKREWERPLSTVSDSGEPLLTALVNENIMVVQAPLVRRQLMEAIGGFDSDLRKLEDWDCWVRCALTGATFLYDSGAGADCFSYVRVHNDSTSTDQIAMHSTVVQVREGLDARLPTPELRELNRRRIHDHWAIIGMLQGLGDHLVLGMKYLIRAGLAERKVKWLAWGVLMPLVRRPPGSWAMSRLRTARARRRDEEVRDWLTYWP
jgi:glycosyltransferase involved in cell wall biosynthesis